jgi:type III pantothenate kinase
MLMVIDIGNTNIVVGLFEGERLEQSWRIHTVAEKTEDEYEIIFRSLFAANGIEPHAVAKAAVSSVVPMLTRAIVSTVRDLTGVDPLLVGPEIYDRLVLSITTQDPYELGTDLVSNAIAAWDLFHGPCAAVDFGTALSFTYVSRKAEIVGVSLAPGLNTAVASLSRDTAQLPFVPLAVPLTVIGRNTIHSVQAGIVYGWVGLVESMISRVKKELGDDLKVVATGGLCGVIAPLTSVFDLVDPDLTLDGLACVAEYVSAER